MASSPTPSTPPAPDGTTTGTTRALLPYAILTGLCGLLPVPLVDEYAASLARGAMLRRTAHRHDLKVDRFAQRILVRPPSPIGGAPAQFALSALRMAFRKVFLVVNVGLRADDALSTFVLGYLFDRYCREQHPREQDGEWVTEGKAGQIRAAVDAALRGAGSVVLRRDEQGGEESVEEFLREEKGFFGRVADLAAQSIGEVGDDYFRSVEEAFDASMGVRPRADVAPPDEGAPPAEGPPPDEGAPPPPALGGEPA